ncbi:MAG: hypothetical protein KF799_08580 [Bdellovibrionales bacterium]|nr:hypothetical protein [Bdellovibrionales bacterium]
MKFAAFCVSLLIFVSGPLFAASYYPTTPDDKLTPGSLCGRPDSRRYPQRIPYCKRNVSKSEKWQVIETYNEHGWDIQRGDRGQFKIDHLIPLCAGGSNQKDNLWPQHRTVYEITDRLEGLACEKMAAGRLRQARAVELILRAKHNLAEAPAIEAEIEAL